MGLTDNGRSVTLPCLRNFGDQPANGPNSSHDRPLITRVSRCGTDIGGAPSGGRPYTLAWCAAASSGLPVRRNCAADREAAEALGLLDARLLQQRQRTAARADEDELGVDLARRAPVRRLWTFTVQLPSDSLCRSRTSWPNSVVMPRCGGVADAAGVTANRSRRRCRPAVQFSATGSEKSRSGGHQRQPAGELVVVVDELHRGEQRVARPACRGGGAGSRRARRRARS